MEPQLELPPRPEPPRTVRERVQGWLVWVGYGRVVGGAVVVLAVLAGGYWLVRPPAATTESTLPYAAPHTSTTLVAPAGGSPAAGGSTDAQVVVHVAGAVANPGVYSVAAGARVITAVQAAGGFAVDANPDAINLAAKVSDGQRIYVPKVGESVVAADGGVQSGPLNLNQATAEQLDTLPGVGPATAAAIIAYRDQHGPFGNVDDLADVRGIGPAKLDALRGLVTV